LLANRPLDIKETPLRRIPAPALTPLGWYSRHSPQKAARELSGGRCRSAAS